MCLYSTVRRLQLPCLFCLLYIRTVQCTAVQMVATAAVMFHVPSYVSLCVFMCFVLIVVVISIIAFLRRGSRSIACMAVETGTNAQHFTGSHYGQVYPSMTAICWLLINANPERLRSGQLHSSRSASWACSLADTLCVLCLQLPDHGAFSSYYGSEFMQE